MHSTAHVVTGMSHLLVGILPWVLLIWVSLLWHDWRRLLIGRVNLCLLTGRCYGGNARHGVLWRCVGILEVWLMRVLLRIRVGLHHGRVARMIVIV